MKVSRVLILFALLACSACTTVAPVATVGPSATSSVPATSTGSPPSTGPLATTAPVSSTTATTSPTSETVATPSATPAEAPSATPTKTPKPTRKPTPTPSPTPTPTPVDVAIYVNTSDLPNPWYNNTDYTLPIHVISDVNSVTNAHVKVSIPLEGFATSFDTGPIAPGDDYVHNVTINVIGIGPATLMLSVKAPSGYADITPSNNKVTIAIDVMLKP